MGLKLTISDQVNPQELDGDECLWHTQGGGKEDADDFANIGRNQVADELDKLQ